MQLISLIENKKTNRLKMFIINTLAFQRKPIFVSICFLGAIYNLAPSGVLVLYLILHLKTFV